LWCCPQEEKGGLMSDKKNTDSSVVELKGRTCSISKQGSQVDFFAAMTRAMGREFGHKMRMLVLYGKEASIVPPTLDARATKQDEMKWSKDYDVFIKKKTANVFAIILSRCKGPMKTKVEGHPKYAQMEQDCDVAVLLEVIKEIPMTNNIQHASSECMEAVGVLPSAGECNNCPVQSAVNGDSGPDRADVWDYCTVSDGGF
jgi:hypothetical protein